jgi:hypothetical protein
LPFKVVGLDFWNGKPMATISVKDTNGSPHYRLVGEGMTLSSNWKLVKLTANPNTAIFSKLSNKKSQKVRVVL